MGTQIKKNSELTSGGKYRFIGKTGTYSSGKLVSDDMFEFVQFYIVDINNTSSYNIIARIDDDETVNIVAGHTRTLTCFNKIKLSTDADYYMETYNRTDGTYINWKNAQELQITGDTRLSVNDRPRNLDIIMPGPNSTICGIKYYYMDEATGQLVYIEGSVSGDTAPSTQKIKCYKNEVTFYNKPSVWQNELIIAENPYGELAHTAITNNATKTITWENNQASSAFSIIAANDYYTNTITIDNANANDMGVDIYSSYGISTQVNISATVRWSTDDGITQTISSSGYSAPYRISDTMPFEVPISGNPEYIGALITASPSDGTIVNNQQFKYVYTASQN